MSYTFEKPSKSLRNEFLVKLAVSNLVCRSRKFTKIKAIYTNLEGLYLKITTTRNIFSLFIFKMSLSKYV